MKSWLARWETIAASFCASPWASGVLLLIGAAWIIAEAHRGKAIGWDGFITLAALEVALATYRKRPQ